MATCEGAVRGLSIRAASRPNDATSVLILVLLPEGRAWRPRPSRPAAIHAGKHGPPTTRRFSSPGSSCHVCRAHDREAMRGTAGSESTKISDAQTQRPSYEAGAWTRVCTDGTLRIDEANVVDSESAPSASAGLLRRAQPSHKATALEHAQHHRRRHSRSGRQACRQGRTYRRGGPPRRREGAGAGRAGRSRRDDTDIRRCPDRGHRCPGASSDSAVLQHPTKAKRRARRRC
jgi:hypothetical protein